MIEIKSALRESHAPRLKIEQNVSIATLYEKNNFRHRVGVLQISRNVTIQSSNWIFLPRRRSSGWAKSRISSFFQYQMDFPWRALKMKSGRKIITFCRFWHFEASRRGMENQSCRPIEAFRAILKTPSRKRTRGNAENVSIAARDAKRPESVARPGAQNGVSPWKKSRSARPRANSRFANFTKRFYSCSVTCQEGYPGNRPEARNRRIASIAVPD